MQQENGSSNGNGTKKQRLTVFSIRDGKGGSVWVRAGTAFVNKDGSLNLILDVLPLDGKLHVRESVERNDNYSRPAAAPSPTYGAPATDAAMAAGGHS